MIEKLMIFESTGICLYSKHYKDSSLTNDDELTSGFLSALFRYIDSQFGDLKYIRTVDKTLFISQIQGIYITLVTTFFQHYHDEKNKERYSILNYRLENTCKALLALIERKVGILVLQLHLRKVNSINYKSLFADLEPDLNSIIKQGLQKIGIIQKLYENPTISNALEV